MIRVTIVMEPHGDASRAEVLHEIEIVNVTPTPHTSPIDLYSVRDVSGRLPMRSVAHHRALSATSLVARALKEFP